MRARRRVLQMVVLLGVSGATAAAALGATTGWGTAIEVPGTAALNTGGGAGVGAVSCAGAGNCSAVGSLSGGAFAVNEKSGVWGSAVKVQIGRGGSLYSVSCAAAGSCSAGGQYTSRSSDKAFLVTEKNGVWGKAIDVPGLPHVKYGDSWVSQVSCAKPGFCSAGGSYADGHTCSIDGAADYCYQAFVVNEVKGVWQKAIEAPGSAHLNHGNASVDTVSCPSAGYCTAAGTYRNAPFSEFTSLPFVMRESHGVWGKAVRVRLSAALLADGDIGISQIACSTASSCAAVGYIDDFGGGADPFLVTEKNGVWGKGIAVPGLDDVLFHGAAEASLDAISCASAGSCTAGGTYTDDFGNHQPFLVTETNGVWGNAFDVPGFGTLNAVGWADLSSVSCATAASCAATGSYSIGANAAQAFVVGETNGVWSAATEVPGTAALNVGAIPQAGAAQISCAKSGSCVVGGFYTDGSGHTQAFVTSP
jgi:hypothetical protein